MSLHIMTNTLLVIKVWSCKGSTLGLSDALYLRLAIRKLDTDVRPLLSFIILFIIMGIKKQLKRFVAVSTKMTNLHDTSKMYAPVIRLLLMEVEKVSPLSLE